MGPCDRELAGQRTDKLAEPDRGLHESIRNRLGTYWIEY